MREGIGTPAPSGHGVRPGPGDTGGEVFCHHDDLVPGTPGARFVRATGAHLVGLVVAPAYWALDGLRATFKTDLLNSAYPGAPGHYQPPLLGPGGPLFVDLLALAFQMTVPLISTHRLPPRRLGVSARGLVGQESHSHGTLPKAE